MKTKLSVFLVKFLHTFFQLLYFALGFVFLRSISVMDFLAMLGLFIWFALEVFSPVNQHNQNMICKTVLWFITSCLNSTSYLICTMGLERLYAIYRPVSYRDNVKKSRNVKISITCIVIAFWINSTGLFYIGNDVGFCFGVQNDVSQKVALILATFLGVLNYFSPMLLLIIINAVLIVKLRGRQSGQYRFCIQSSNSFQ